MTDGIRVLHVDDDPGLADLAATFIQRYDDRFSVETAHSAEEGLECLDEFDVDCIVSDYEMPGQNGIEFLEVVRDSNQDLPFILYTGKGSEAVASDAISAGVTDYLQKESGTSHFSVLANRIINVVEQYRTSQAVEEAEDKLSVIANKSEDILYMFDAEWEELLFINSAYEEIWNGSIDELEEDPRSFLENIHPEDREIAVQSMERLSKGTPDTVEYRLEHADGEHRWVRGESKPIFDEDGSMTAVVGFVRNITEQKERAQELERITERYQTLVENGSDITTELDEDGVMQYHSPAVESVLGYAPSELEGDNAFEYIHPDDRDQARKQLVDVINNPETVTGREEFRFKHADGSWVWLETIGSNRTDSATDGYILTSRAITDRKEREQRLRALNDASTALMTGDSGEAVVETGVDAADEILGLEANGIHMYDAEREALVPVAQTAPGQELVNDQPTFTGGDSIAWRVFKAGEPRAIDDVSEDPDVYNTETAIQSELYLPLGDHGILIAASESREAFDEEDIVLGEILARTVAAALDQVERTEQLTSHEQALRQQNDRLEEFTSVVSHDLQNPLQVAAGRVDLAIEDNDVTHLEDAARALERMDTLITDLRTLARDGDKIGERERIHIGALTKRSWQNIEQGSATLDVHIDETIRADKSRFQQLMENLLRNAVEHADENVTITVGPLDGGFYVEDDGPGIPAADREAVFSTNYSQSNAGSGLGLSIVEQIVNAHGWSVHVVDGSSGGARFEVMGIEFDEQ